MKASKLYLLLAGSIFGLFSAGLILLTLSLYRNVDESGSRVAADYKVIPLLANLQEEFRNADSAEQIEQHFHSLEVAPSMASKSSQVSELKKAYAPLIAHFQTRPKDADARSTLLKKKDFLDATLNFYRKEVPNGDLQVRALLLNIIFDTHSSFLGEAAEMEMVYIKKCRERLSSLKSVANEGRSPGIGYRLTGLENLFSLYEKAATQNWTWNEDHHRLLGEAEKASAQIITSLRHSSDMAASSARRDFLQNVLICAVVVFLCFGLLYFGHIKFQSQFAWRADLVKKYFAHYGQDKLDSINAKELATLKNDGDWGPLFQDLQDLEQNFTKSFEAQRAISQFSVVPYLVLNRSNEVVYWNDALQDLLGLSKGEQLPKLEEVVHAGIFGRTPTLGQLEADVICKAITDSSSIETFIRQGQQATPVEIIVSTITAGKYLTGGRVVMFRTIPNEMARVQKRLVEQLNYVRSAVSQVNAGEAISQEYRHSDTVEANVKETIDSIADFKLKIDEREALWKSEIQALIDQVNRQKDILEKISLDFSELRGRQEKITRFFASVYETERVVNTELSALERNLEAWNSQQNRLQTEVAEQLQLLERAREYESSVRESIQRFRGDIDTFANGLNELRRYREEIRLKALNLSLGREPGSETFAARVRAYAVEIDRFCQQIEQISHKMREFVDRNPGSALFPMLSVGDFDAALLEDFRKGQAMIGTSVSQWKVSTDTVLQTGVEVQEILSTIQDKSDEVQKLSQACMVIADKTKENLVRWN